MVVVPVPDLGPLEPGLYIVATPIGNLGDVSARAAAILASADVIAAEDTRVTAKLLAHLAIHRPMIPYHDHNADMARPALLERMATQSVALVSDAGTPLISDPGYKLVRDARAAGIPVTAAPGPCAAIAALTLSGLPTDRFMFAGFLPAKAKARADVIAALAEVPATLIFYESGPRLGAALAALAEGLGPRGAVVLREITKRFEEAVEDTLSGLAERYRTVQPRGEIVIVVAPPPPPEQPGSEALDAALTAALAGQPLRSAVAQVTAELGLARRTVYARALELRETPEVDA